VTWPPNRPSKRWLTHRSRAGCRGGPPRLVGVGRSALDVRQRPQAALEVPGEVRRDQAAGLLALAGLGRVDDRPVAREQRAEEEQRGGGRGRRAGQSARRAHHAARRRVEPPVRALLAAAWASRSAAGRRAFATPLLGAAPACRVLASSFSSRSSSASRSSSSCSVQGCGPELVGRAPHRTGAQGARTC